MVKPPMAKADGKIYSFKLPKALHQRLKVAAAQEDRPMHDLVKDALGNYLTKAKGKA